MPRLKPDYECYLRVGNLIYPPSTRGDDGRFKRPEPEAFQSSNRAKKRVRELMAQKEQIRVIPVRPNRGAEYYALKHAGVFDKQLANQSKKT